MYANLRDDARVQRAADEEAAWLLVESMLYCTAAESQGVIPFSQVKRFGANDSERKVKALLREGLWIPVDGAYLLDPDIWSEERNLFDAAAKKKQADRERIAAKRAAEKAAREGGRADPGGSRATVARHVARQAGDRVGDSRAYKREEKNREDLQPQPPLTPPQAGGTASRCKTHKRPRRGCADCALPPLAPVPDHCGRCNPSRRLENCEGIYIGPCPACHPSVVRSA